jgi:SAM-dependent methyltransferase
VELTRNDIQRFFVKRIYADHNNSPRVRKTLDRLIANLEQNAFALNIGAGLTRIAPNIKNLEIQAGLGIDYVGSVESIPIDDDQVDLVITQEVLEHVADPFRAVSEIKRVLKEGGLAFIQLPFVIGYHPCPHDYWRFTDEGLEQLVKQAGFAVVERGTVVGPAVGAYRILVEFLTIMLSLPHRSMYQPAKALFSILLYPIKWLDGVAMLSPEAKRISGGYFVVVRK